MGSTATIRRRQIEVADGPEGFGFVRQWLSAKLRHQVEFLEELKRRRPGAEAVFSGPLGTIQDCLAKVQALAGDLESNRVEEILLASQELMDLKTDSIYVFPMCREDFDKVRIIGQGFDQKLVADEVLTKVI